MVRKVSEMTSFQSLYEAFEGIAFGRLPGKKDDSVDEEIKKRAQTLRKQVKKQIEELRNDFFLLSPDRFSVRKSSFSIKISICFWTVLFSFVLRACGSKLP